MADDLEAIQCALSVALQRFLQQAQNRLQDATKCSKKPEQGPVTWNCSVLISPIKSNTSQNGKENCQCRASKTFITRKREAAKSSIEKAVEQILPTRTTGSATAVKRKVSTKCVEKKRLPKKENIYENLNKVCQQQGTTDTESSCNKTTEPECAGLPKLDKIKKCPREEHINRLATPKRREDIQMQSLPAPIKASALEFVPTQRLLCLARPRYRPEYKDLPKSLEICEDALCYNPTERILNLNKNVPKRYLQDDDYACLPDVSESAMKYEPTQRTLELAKPIQRVMQCPSFIWLPEKIDPKALAYRATPRIKRLARPKREKPLQLLLPRPVKKQALNYTATPRIIKLAKPKIRRDKLSRVYPFAVKKAALEYVSSERLEKLAQAKWMTMPMAIKLK